MRAELPCRRHSARRAGRSPPATPRRPAGNRRARCGQHTPVRRYNSAPASCSTSSTASRPRRATAAAITPFAARMTSGPMPSPGSATIRYVLGIRRNELGNDGKAVIRLRWRWPARGSRRRRRFAAARRRTPRTSLRELIEIGQAFDDDDVPAEQNAMDDGQLLEAVHVGHRGRLDAEQSDLPLDQPRGQFGRNAGQLVAIGGRAEAAVPVGPQQQPIARTNPIGPRRKCARRRSTPAARSASDRARGLGRSRRPGPSVRADRRRHKMPRGIHVRAAVRIQRDVRRVPAVALQRLEARDLGPRQALVDRQREIDDPRAGGESGAAPELAAMRCCGRLGRLDTRPRRRRFFRYSSPPVSNGRPDFRQSMKCRCV